MKQNQISPVTLDQKINQLKNRLLQEIISHTQDPSLFLVLEIAAEEAAALVSRTPYPLLFLPTLLEEKTQALIAARHKENGDNLSLAA
jgi:hypothetical protein